MPPLKIVMFVSRTGRMGGAKLQQNGHVYFTGSSKKHQRLYVAPLKTLMFVSRTGWMGVEKLEQNNYFYCADSSIKSPAVSCHKDPII